MYKTKPCFRCNMPSDAPLNVVALNASLKHDPLLSNTGELASLVLEEMRGLGPINADLVRLSDQTLPVGLGFREAAEDDWPGLVTRTFVKPGATVIDVGMNKVTDSVVAQSLFAEGHPRLGVFRSKGSVLVGDVHPDVADVAGALTPVPGGVGPLTITMLMKNTLRAAKIPRH